MQGAGNDFIFINNIEEKLPRSCLPALAQQLCRRRLSIGADGLMVVEKPEDGGDYRMLFFNSDGSAGEMCGNGARCLARYGYERGLAGETQRMETPSGLVTGRRVSERMYTVRLNDPSVIDLHRTAEAGGKKYECAYVELGVPGLPHAVFQWDDFDRRDEDELRRTARGLRWFRGFPKGANVTFCRLAGADSVVARTFERGVEDFTLACGTGCGSVVTALTLLGRVSGQNVKVAFPGGDLFVSLTREGDSVRDILLTGPTDVVAEGLVLDEDLKLPEGTV